MIDILRDWYSRNFSDPQAVILALLLVVVFGLVWLFGDILAPVLVALVLAYLLEASSRRCSAGACPGRSPRRSC